jgi:Ca-activated chloride channel family protein
MPGPGHYATSVVRSLIHLALIGLSTAALLAVQQDREEGQFTIGVDVDLVVFNVAVTDSKGRPVYGLGQNDFRVYEDGRRETLTLFHSEDEPASIGLIIDNSGSMRNKHAEVVDSAVAFVGASNPDDDVFIVTFNERVSLDYPGFAPSTSDPERLRSTLLAIAPAGLTALYDAVTSGLDHLKTSARERKALVVLSDGGDNASRHTLSNVVQLAQKSSATIYTIGIYDADDMDQNPRVLRKLANLTGGQAYFPTAVKDLKRIWTDIAGTIRSQYTLGYISSNRRPDGAFRKVKVTASNKAGQSLRAQTREGYPGPVSTSIQR